MALKGINEINDIINEFLEPFELTAELGTDFDYCYFEDKIHYALAVGDVSSKLFLENAAARFPDIQADVFLWSLLHEVGHSETLDDLEDGVEELCMETKEELDAHVEDWSIESRYQIYFNCPDEKAATDWAGNYMMENPEEIAAFWNTLQPALINFYKLNEVA
jgi:hypothetical protein